MSTTAPEPTEATSEQPAEQPKPTETVDFWKQKAREQEKRAKENADAAKRLADIEQANLTESEKAAQRIAAAEAEVASVPTKVAEALRDSLIALGVVPESRKVLLTASDPETLLAQVKAIQELEADNQKRGLHVSREGRTPPPGKVDEEREAVRSLFGGA